jgi:hypothetical protein
MFLTQATVDNDTYFVTLIYIHRHQCFGLIYGFNFLLKYQGIVWKHAWSSSITCLWLSGREEKMSFVSVRSLFLKDFSSLSGSTNLYKFYNSHLLISN